MFKKLFVAFLTLCCLGTIMSCSSPVLVEKAFKVGDEYYESLQEACDAAVAGTTSTVEMVRDAKGPGVALNLGSAASVTIDFGDYTYTLDGTGDGVADFSISGDYFDISGSEVRFSSFVVSGTKAKIVGDGKTMFMLNDTNLVIGPGILLESDDGVLFAEANTSDIYVDAYFDEAIGGDVKLNNGKLYINSKEGNLDIGKLDITGKESQVVFYEPRTAGDMEIGEIVIDSQTAPSIVFTTDAVFTDAEYDEIDKILKTKKVHRHAFKSEGDRTVLAATCCTNRYDAFSCTDSNCDYIDYREVEGTIDSSKHSLVPVDAVEPTATTSGIEECMRCENCYQYFDKDDTTKVVNPILLATDNALYSDMEKAGLNDLNTMISNLEAGLDVSSETKDLIPEPISALLDFFGFAMEVSGLFDSDDIDEDILKTVSKIDEEMGNITEVITELSNVAKQNVEYTFFNERRGKLIDFRSHTAPCYREILSILETKSGDWKDAIKSKLSDWVRDVNLVTVPKTLMDECTGGDVGKQGQKLSASGRNYFESYDYFALVTSGWEHLARKYRTAFFAFEEDVMLMGYEMVSWYYEYYLGKDPETDYEVRAFEDSWERYRVLCEESQPDKQEKYATCYLNGYNYRFETTPYIADYEGKINELKGSLDLNAFWSSEYADTKASVDLLNKAVSAAAVGSTGVESVPSEFYDAVFKWYGERNESEKKNIYEILEEYAGFKSPLADKKLSECYAEKMYLISYPGDEFKLIDDGFKYKTICTGQWMLKKNKDWIAIRSVAGNKRSGTSLETKKIYTNMNISTTTGKIGVLGNPTGNKFFYYSAVEI